MLVREGGNHSVLQTESQVDGSNRTAKERRRVATFLKKIYSGGMLKMTKLAFKKIK